MLTLVSLDGSLVVLHNGFQGLGTADYAINTLQIVTTVMICMDTDGKRMWKKCKHGFTQDYDVNDMIVWWWS